MSWNSLSTRPWAHRDPPLSTFQVWGSKACTTVPGIMWFCISFSNIKFLLINWEFHIMHPNYTHFPILPGQPPSTLVSDSPPRPPPPEKKKKSSICDARILTGMVQLPVASPFKKTEFLPISAPARMLHLSILIIIFKSSLQWLFSIGCYFLGE